jgi:hypothetical protein
VFEAGPSRGTPVGDGAYAHVRAAGWFARRHRGQRRRVAELAADRLGAQISEAEIDEEMRRRR